MPQSNDDEQRMSKGYAFVEFNTPEVSMRSLRTLPLFVLTTLTS